MHFMIGLAIGLAILYFLTTTRWGRWVLAATTAMCLLGLIMMMAEAHQERQTAIQKEIVEKQASCADFVRHPEVSNSDLLAVGCAPRPQAAAVPARPLTNVVMPPHAPY